MDAYLRAVRDHTGDAQHYPQIAVAQGGAGDTDARRVDQRVVGHAGSGRSGHGGREPDVNRGGSPTKSIVRGSINGDGTYVVVQDGDGAGIGDRDGVVNRARLR